jgi:hypothetical protein
VIIDNKGGSPGVIPYLPLPEVQQRRNPPASQPTPGASQQ